MMDSSATVSPPSTCRDVKNINMAQLREVCRVYGVQHSGRVTKNDLFHLVCQHFNISMSG